jgi:hypothetical protein
MARRWRSAPAVAAHRERIASGPLAPHVAPQLRAWLDAPDGVDLDPSLRIGMEAISLLHDWCDRYRDRLADLDPEDLRG